MIVDNDPSLQFNMKPVNMVSIEKQLLKALDKKEISDLKFGREITVIEENGFYKELN